MREKLIKILRVPIFPHELADTTEAVADYLLDNDVVPVVRCKDCKYWKDFNGLKNCVHLNGLDAACADDYCSSGSRKETINIPQKTMDALNKMGEKAHGSC